MKVRLLRFFISGNKSFRKRQKVSILFLILLFAVGVAHAATITTTGSGNWSSTTANAPWPLGIIPAPGDDIIIGAGFTLTVDGARTCLSMRVGNGSTLTVNGSVVLTVTNALSFQNLAAANATGTVAGGGTLNAGSVSIGGGNVPAGNFTTTVTSTITALNSTGAITLTSLRPAALANNPSFQIQSGTVTATGTLSCVTTNNVASTTLVTLQTGVGQTGYLKLANNTPITTSGNNGVPTFSFNGTASTVEYSGGAQTVRGVAYRNLALSGTLAKTLSAGMTINGNLTMTGTTNTTTVANLSVGGNLDIGDGTTLTTGNFTFGVTGTTTVGGGASGSLVLGGTQAKTFTGDIDLNAGSTWNETGNATIGIGGSFTNDAGTFTSNAGIHTFSGATKTLSGATNTAIPTANFTGSYTNSGTFTSATSLTITNPAILTNDGTVTVNAMAGAGGLTQGATGVLNVGGSSTVTLIATAASNTVNFTGAAGQAVIAVNYYNLGLAGVGAKNLAAGTTTVSGNLIMSGTATTATVVGLGITGNLIIGDGTTFTAANTTLNVTGTTTVGGGASGTLAISNATGTKTFTGDVTFNSGSTLNETAAATVNFGGSLTNNAGTFTASTGTHDFTGTSKTLSGSTTTAIPNASFSGTYTNNGTLTASTTLIGAGTLTQGTTGVLNIGGTSTITTLNATTAGNLVDYQGAAQTVKATNYYDLTFSGSGAKTLAAGTTAISGDFTLSGTASTTAVVGLTVGGNITLGTGTTFTAGAFTHNITGDWLNNGGTFTNTGSTINLNGADQSIGGSSATTFNNLTLAGSGVKTISTTPAISGNFTLSGTASTTAIAALTIGGNVTLGSGTTFTAGPYTHNVAGNWTNNGATFVNAGSTINFNGAAQAIGGTSSAAFNSVTLSGSSTKTFNVTSTTADRFTINSGVQANLNTFTTHTTNSLLFGSVAQIAGTWGGTGSTATNINTTFFAAAAGILTVAVQGSTTYYSRQTGSWNATTTWSTVTYSNATNAGTFPVAGDIVNIGGGNYTITVNVNSACALISFLGNEGFDQTVSLNAGITLNVSGAINLPTGNGFGDVNTFAVNAGTLNAGSIAFTTGGVFGSHPLTISTGTATINGNVTQNGLNPGAITFSGAGLLKLGGDLPNYCSLTPSTGTVEYFGVGAQNVSNITTLGGQSSYNNLTFSGAGVKTAGGDIDVNGVLTLASGTSFTGGPYTMTLAGNWVNNGATFTNTNSTITLDGGAQSIGGTTATTFNNLTLSGGTKAFSLVTTIDGLLSISSGALANLGSITTHFARALALNGAGQVAGSWGSTSSAATNKNNTYFTALTTGILNVSSRAYFFRGTANGNWNVAGTWSTVGYGSTTNTGTFPVAGDIANVGGGDFTVTVNVNSACATLNFEAGAANSPIVSISGTNTLDVSGAVNIPNGGTTFGSDANTVAVGAGTLNAGSIAFSTGGSLFGTHVLTVSTGTVNVSGDITQAFPDATLNITGAGTLTLGGAFLNSTNCTCTLSNTGTTVHYLGSVAQTIGDFTYYNLTLNNTSGSVPQLTLFDDATVSNTLTMTAGVVNLNSNTISLTNTASTALSHSLASTSGWMYGGPISRAYVAGTAVTIGTAYGLFPLGTSANWRPLYFGKNNNPNTGGTLTVSHNGSDNGTSVVSFYDDGSTQVTRRSNSYWTVTKTSGLLGGGLPYSLQAGGTGFGTIQDVDDLRLTQASNEVGTTSLPNGGTTASPLVNKINISNVLLARNYYVASIDATNSPLPVSLLYFRAEVQNNVVTTTWSTAQELNNAFFTVERAIDIEKFEAVGELIPGAGSTLQRHDYSMIDESPLYGRSYYRLKQTDFDGNFTYSNVQVVDYEGPKFASLRAYPNPSDGSGFTILVTGLKEQTSVPLQIYNVQGQIVYNGTLDVSTPGTLKREIEFGSPLRAGIYLIKAGPSLQLTQKIFIK